jgi:hypothetical protein
MALETMAEQLPEQFVSQPKLGVERAMSAEQRGKEEKTILTRAGVNIVDQVQDENGFWTFSTQPIPRDEKTGKPALGALRKAGALYQVRSSARGNRIIQVPGRLK